MKTEESVIDFPKSELCPDIWEKVMSTDGMREVWQLKPEVERKLIDIVKMVCEESKTLFEYTYTNITGSITSNCYTKNADIDVHIHLTMRIREPSDITQNRFKYAFKKVKQHYDTEGLKGDESYYVAGHPIEVYYQPNEFQDLMSVGCYNLMSRKWIVGPEFKDQSYNPYSDLYKDIQAKSDCLAQQIRNMILSIYEIAVVFKKNYSNDFGPQIRLVLISKLSEVQSMYDKIRNMRKIYSSPESAEQAMKYRSSRKWKVADASFKLFDKYGYIAIMKKFIEDYELIESSNDVDLDVVEDILATVKNYINNADKLAEQEIESEAEDEKQEEEVHESFKEYTELPADTDNEGRAEFKAEDVLAFAKEANINCTEASAYTDDGHQTITVKGDFPDRISLDSLTFYWKEDSWYQAIRCKNKWNEKMIDILNVLYPNGLKVQNIDVIDALFKRIKNLNLNKLDEDIKGTTQAALLAAMLAVPGIVSAKQVEQWIYKDGQYSVITKQLNDVRMVGEYTAYQAANIIARTLYAEARSDGVENGFKPVASVIYNRANGKKEDFAKACLKKWQFSCWNGLTDVERTPDGFKIKIPTSVNKSRMNLKLWRSCLAIASEMLAGSFKPVTNANSYYATSMKKPPSWNKELIDVAVFGGHKFGYLKHHAKFV